VVWAVAGALAQGQPGGQETWARLDNGLGLFVRENQAAATVAAVAAVRFSQGEEPSRVRGIRDLLELCLTAPAPAGGRVVPIEGRTEPDFIALAARGTDRNWEDVVRGLLTALTSPRFEGGTVAYQQQLLRRGAEAERELPAAVARRAGLVALYPAAVATVRPAAAYLPVSASALAALWQQVLKPNRVVLAVSGPVEAAAVKAVIEEAAGTWVPGPDVQPPKSLGQASQGPYRLEMTAAASAVWVGARGPEPDDADYPAAVVGMEALARGLGSRLFRRLRDELRLTYDVTGQVVAGRQWPYLYVLATCGEEQVTKASAEIRDQIGRMADEALPEGELTRARRAAVLELTRLRMSNYGAAQYLCSLAAMAPGYVEAGSPWRLGADLEAVGSDRLREACGRFWRTPTVVQVFGHLGG
jgi:predicted Zn-dependent peptidase